MMHLLSIFRFNGVGKRAKRKKSRQPMPVFLSKALLLTTALALGYALLFAHYRLSFDFQPVTCLPWRVWVIDTADHTLGRGDYVAFRADRRVKRFFKPGKSFMKEVVGVPGDHVVIKHGVVIVNHHPISQLYLARLIGKPVSSFARDFIVPSGHYWVMGTHPDSFDSRYWGTISARQILGRGYPIW